MRALRLVLRFGALLLAGLGLAAFWLLGSAGGRDWVLDQVIGALPAGALQVGAREGSLAGGLRLKALRYEDERLQLRIDTLELRPEGIDVAPLTLRYRALSIEGVDLRWAPASDTPPPAWPEMLPALDLPFALAIARVSLRGLTAGPTDAPAPVVVIDHAEAALRMAPGRLEVEALKLLAPQGRMDGRLAYAPAEGFAVDAALEARLAAGARLTLGLAGNLDGGRWHLDGAAGRPLHLEGQWRQAGRLQTLGWQLEAQTEGLATETLGLPGLPPISAHLRLRGGTDVPTAGLTPPAGDASPRSDLSGAGHPVAVEGRLAIEGQAVDLQPSRLWLEPGAVHVSPLALAVLGGELEVSGRYGVDDGALSLQAVARGLGWGEGEQRVIGDGEAQLSGHLPVWQGDLTFDLQRGARQARLEASVSGSETALVLSPFTLSTPGGEASGEGRLDRDAAGAFQLTATLRDLDPAWLLPGWPGRLEGRLALHGAAPAEGPLRLEARVEGLSGALRGVPVDAELALGRHGERLDAKLALALGAGRLHAAGQLAPALDLRLDADRLGVAPWLAAAEGRLSGEVHLTGTPARPGVVADLVLAEARLAGLSAEAVSLRGALPSRGEGRLALRVAGLSGQAWRMDTLTARASGALGAGRLTLEAQAPQGRFGATAEWRAEDGFARGELGLETLDLAWVPWPAVRLQAPARLAWSPSGPSVLQALCLRAGARGALCAEGDAETLRVRGEGLDVAWLSPLLDGAAGGTLRASGEARVQATLRRAGEGYTVEGALRSDEGRLATSAMPSDPVFAWRALNLEVRHGAEGWQGLLSSELPPSGRLEARLRADAGGGLDGQLSARSTELGVLELLSADIAAPKGALEGQFTVGGRVDAPRWEGRIALAPFSVALPALGIDVHEGRVQLEGRGDGDLRLEGVLPTGDGALQLDGLWSAGDGPKRLSLRGEEVRVLDTAEGQAWVSPDLAIELADGMARLRGRVVMPRADLRLDHMETGVSASPDVVVVDDPAPTSTTRGPALDADLRLVLGDAVRLRGFGFDGMLSGSLRVRDRGDTGPRARGALTLSGGLRAYGQRLDLTRGALHWANAPLDEPTLDVLAERPDTTPNVGVALTGSALAPVAEVWSKPPLPQAEALSWLMFGRPLARADGNDAAQLEAAATTLGGSAVAQAVAGKVGLDAASVGESSALGGTALTVGKRITPRLYVSYGMALSGTGQVVTVTYALRRWLAAKLERGVEQRVELEARIDRD